MKKNLRQSPGFTLFELLLVVAIMVIMAGMLFANPNAGQAALAAQRSTQLIVEALREAQNDALGAKVAPGSSVTPPGGWGVSFFQNGDGSYANPILFADMNGDHRYEATADVLVRTIVLDEHAPIIGFDRRGGNSLDIVFLPPNPSVYINGVVTTPTTFIVTVGIGASYGGTTVVKIIFINVIGAIDVH